MVSVYILGLIEQAYGVSPLELYEREKQKDKFPCFVVAIDLLVSRCHSDFMSWHIPR